MQQVVVESSRSGGALYRPCLSHDVDATKLLKKRYGEIASRRFVGPQEERVMFEDLVKGIELDYTLRGLRSMRAAKGRMVHLKKAFGGMRALDITSNRVRDYQAQRRKEKASPATVNRETSHLSRAFRIAVKSCLLTVVPPFPNASRRARYDRASSSTPSILPCASI